MLIFQKKIGFAQLFERILRRAIQPSVLSLEERRVFAVKKKVTEMTKINWFRIALILRIECH